MRKTTMWMAGVAAMGLAVTAGCSSKNEDHSATPPDVDGGGSSSGDGGGSSSGDGGSANLPKPVFCPETDPFSPKLPNSVVISDAVLQADTTWTADKVYLIGDDFQVEHHVLTVEAGTTICLFQSGKIEVGRGIDPGEIHLNGTADKPIVITAPPSASDPTKPDVFHQGIVFDTYQGSSVSYVNIWYGGVGGGSSSFAFALTSTAQGNDKTKPLLIDHLTVGAVQSQGIKIGTELGIADGSSIQFTGFAAPDTSAPPLNAALELEIKSTASVAKAINIAGASIPDAAKHVNLTTAASDGTLISNTDLVDFGLPYHRKNGTALLVHGEQNDTTVGSTLTIHEGVTLKLDSAIVVGSLSGTALGNLVIAGTAAKPVILTSVNDTPASGDWETIYFVGGQFDPARSKIDNAQVLYAGFDPSDGLQLNYHVSRCGGQTAGAIMIDGIGGAYAGPAISNTKIAHSLGDGIASSSSTTGTMLSTSYAKADITFDDIKGKTLENTAACP